LVLFVLGLTITISGNINQYGGLDLSRLYPDIYSNAGTELISIALTVLIIDQLYQRRAGREEIKRLLREVSSKDNATALRAVEELRDRGLIAKGILAGADLKYANLEDVILADADLSGAYLTFANLDEADLRNVNLSGAILRQCNLQRALLLNANLTDAKLLEADLRNANLNGAILKGANLAGATLEGARGLDDETLASCDRLAGTILPNASLYDGRYNLPGDLARIEGNTDEEAASYYGVPVDVYLRSQKTAQQ